MGLTDDEKTRWLLYSTSKVSVSHPLGYGTSYRIHKEFTPAEFLKEFEKSLRKPVRNIEKWCSHNKPERDESKLTGLDKWIMAKFCQMAKEFHEQIEKNDLRAATKTLSDFWFDSINGRQGYHKLVFDVCSRSRLDNTGRKIPRMSPESSKAIMFQYRSVLDQYLRFVALFLPELAAELRESLEVDLSNNTLITMDHISTVESHLSVQKLDEQFSVSLSLKEIVNKFLSLFPERKEKKPIKITIAENSPLIGEALEQFGFLLESECNVEIEYIAIPDYIFFEEYFDAIDGYWTRVYHLGEHRFYLAMNLHFFKTLVPLWEEQLTKLDKKISFDQKNFNNLQRIIAKYHRIEFSKGKDRRNVPEPTESGSDEDPEMMRKVADHKKIAARLVSRTRKRQELVNMIESVQHQYQNIHGHYSSRDEF